MSKNTIFTTPQEAEAAFYQAIERGDLDAMMAVWAEDEDIVCIHPGSARLTGYALVREAWRRIFDSGTRFRVHILALSTVRGPLTAVHSLVESVEVLGEQDMTAPVAATNVYVRGPLGWRMIVHHASPVPPDSIVDEPKVLH